jgi:acyl-CoA ligase (AMP-forming) (exosortase A-associated)
MLPDPTPYPLDHLTLRGAPEAVALKTAARALTYHEFEHEVGLRAFQLKAKGLKRGDRVASWLAKGELACVLPLAAARAGLIHVPINPVLRRAQVAHILSDSGAGALITTLGRIETLEGGDMPDGCAIVTDEALSGPEGHMQPSSENPNDLAAILYTSGSTGKPKGVMLSHANLWLGAVSVAHYLGLEPEDRTLAVLPLSFDYGQNQLLSCWYAGASVIPLDYLRAGEVVKAVEREGITTLAGVPPLWVQLLEVDWPEAARGSLRRITNSGGALTPSLSQKLRALLPTADIYAMYGLTEAFRSTYLKPALLATHPESIGSAIPFAEVMVVRPDGTQAAAEEAGELVHAGPLVAHGYWQDAARTAERFKTAPAWSASGGMAVWSGDTVVADTKGLLKFVGRDDEMIKTSGNRVSPGEIEEAAVASGVVTEAVAFGRKDERLGAVIILIVRGEPQNDAALRAFLKTELPLFMQPAEIIWVDDLPRNPNGKLDRAAIKREYAA